MAKCHICGLQTGNQAEFSVGIGPMDLEMLVCRYCCEDLPRFGVRVNQVVALPRDKLLIYVFGSVSDFRREVYA